MNHTAQGCNPPTTNNRCSVCEEPLSIEDGRLDCGTLQAHWGKAAMHAEECYELVLCEACFFRAYHALREERRIRKMFDEDYDWAEEGFGRAGREGKQD